MTPLPESIPSTVAVTTESGSRSDTPFFANTDIHLESYDLDEDAADRCKLPERLAEISGLAGLPKKKRIGTWQK